MTYHAHSGTLEDRSDWQSLPDHLHAVAELAAVFGAQIGLQGPARLAGIFHDLGKYSVEFQRRLKGENVRVDHSTAGAAMLLSMAQGARRGMAELVARGGVDRNYWNADVPLTVPCVAPRVVAWIETGIFEDGQRLSSVAPRGGRGSKPCSGRRAHIDQPSRPSRGAWIEPRHRHQVPLRGCLSLLAPRSN